jgi:hypothetical protein
MWLRRLFRHRKSQISQHPPIQEPRVALILEDGTSVSLPKDPEWDDMSGYLARNLIPGAGSSDGTGP